MREVKNYLQNKSWSIITCLTLLVIIYFIFFQRLGSNHIRPWDESMFAVNAYEMLHNHHFFVPTYKGVPDFWNLKPPMQVWVQMLFIKFMGFNETAVRIPSAIATAIVAFLLFSYSKKMHSSKFAWCVFLVFVTGSGLTDVHMARTGDSDALLSLFICLSVLSYFNFINGEQPKNILIFFLFLTLAIITKSVVSLLVIPGLFAFTIADKKLKMLFYNPWFYIGTVCLIMIVAAIVLIRENGNPGYIQAVFECDIQRLATVRKSPYQEFQFYFNNFFERRFLWLWLLLPGYFLMRQDRMVKPFADFMILVIVSYFLIISASITKLEWYDMPLYPFMAFICAYPVYVLIIKLAENIHSVYAHSAAYMLIFIIPLYFSFRKSQKDEIPSDQKKLEQLYKYAYAVAHEKIPARDITYLNSNFDRPLQFYKYMIKDKGYSIEIVSNTDSLKAGLNIAVADENLKALLFKKFELKEIEKFEHVHVYRTLKLKQP